MDDDVALLVLFDLDRLTGRLCVLEKGRPTAEGTRRWRLNTFCSEAAFKPGEESHGLHSILQATAFF